MGKSSRPLWLCIEESIDGPTFQVLRDQGYTITRLESSDLGGVNGSPDLFLGPRCWMMTRDVADDPKLLEAAIKHARLVRYGLDNKKEVKGKNTSKSTQSHTGRPVQSSQSGRVSSGHIARGTRTEILPNQTSYFAGPNSIDTEGG